MRIESNPAVLKGTPTAAFRTPPPPGRLVEETWRRTRWEPHGMQREILLDRTRNQVVAAGRRAGKSQTGGHKLVPEAFRALMESDRLRARGMRREYWIVGPEYSDAEKEFRVVWNALERLEFPFDRPGSYNNPLSGEMRISLFDGLFIIHAKSAKYPSTLVGEGLSGVVFSEAAKLKLSVWNKFIRPTLADFGGWSFFGSTPEGKNWFYDLWRAGQDPDRSDWASWRAPSWCNPYVYPGGCDTALLDRCIEARRRHALPALVEELRREGGWDGDSPKGIDPEIWSMFVDMSTEMFKQEVGADFTEYVGRVFKDFDEEVHVTDDGYRAHWATYACADYGFTNPFVWLIVQVDPHGERVHVVDEYYERGRTTEEAASDILSRGLAPRSVRAFYPDPSEPDRTRTLSRMLRIPAASPGNLSVQDRIEWIRRKLRLSMVGIPVGGEARPALTIARRCVNTIREFNDYRYPETAEQADERNRSAPENPMKKDDHTPEALGRFFSGRFGSPYSARARQSRVSVRR